MEFKANTPGNWGIKIYGESNEDLNAVIHLTYKGYENQKVDTEGTINEYFDFANYGESSSKAIPTPTKDYQMILGQMMEELHLR